MAKAVYHVVVTVLIGAELTTLMDKKRMTPSVLAFRTGLNVNVIEMMMQNRISAGYHDITAIAKTLGVTINDLAGAAFTERPLEIKEFKLVTD